MELKRNNEIVVKSWLNEKPMTDETWEVFSRDDSDTLFIFVRDPATGNELKMKIEKVVENLKVEPKENKTDTESPSES